MVLCIGIEMARGALGRFLSVRCSKFSNEDLMLSNAELDRVCRKLLRLYFGC